MHDEYRCLRDGLERVIGDDERDFDDPVGIGPQTRHLEVDPDQPVRVLWHGAKRKMIRSIYHSAADDRLRRPLPCRIRYSRLPS